MKRKIRRLTFKERVRRRNEFDGSLVYGTRQFNLMTGRKEHISHRTLHDNRWMDKKTGVIADRFAQKRNCPLCGSRDYRMLFLKNGFPHVKCVSCELVYVTHLT